MERKPLCIFSAMSSSRVRRCGSASMMSSAFSAEATLAGVIEALKTTGRARCLMKLMTSYGPAITPPRLAKLLLKVPITRSVWASRPKYSAVPRPCSPSTPMAWASSVITRARKRCASSTIFGRLQRSPSMENTPSVMMIFPASGSAPSSSASRWAMSLCR